MQNKKCHILLLTVQITSLLNVADNIMKVTVDGVITVNFRFGKAQS